MSCCIDKKDKCSSQEGLKKLRKHFDSVEVEDMEKFRLLTLKDRANKSTTDWMVWIQVKLSYGYSIGHTQRSDEELLTSLCEDILKWVDVLKNFDKGSKVKQLSLFEDEKEDELEKKPDAPKSDGNWSKYFKDCENVDKRNLMKKHTFFDLCDLTHSIYIYEDIERRHLLPQSNEELVEIIKETILQSESEDELEEEFYYDERNEWDTEYNSLSRGNALSDIEIRDVIRMKVRLYFVPYTRQFRVSHGTEFEKCIEHRFWFLHGRMEDVGFPSANKLILPNYDISSQALIDWVREFYKIPFTEPISDENILKENVKYFFNSMFRDEDSFINVVNSSKDWKQFRASIKSAPEYNNNGGGSGYSIDGFNGSYSRFGKGEISVEQNLNDRINMGRSSDDLKPGRFNDERVVLYYLTDDDIFKKAYELFKVERVRQSTIFDFMSA